MPIFARQICYADVSLVGWCMHNSITYRKAKFMCVFIITKNQALTRVVGNHKRNDISMFQEDDWVLVNIYDL